MNQTVTRTISGVLFLAIMVCGLLFNQYVFAALIIFIMVVMMLEFYALTMEGRFMVSRGFAIFAGVTLFTLIFLSFAIDLPAKYIGLALIPLIVVMILSLYSKDRAEFKMAGNLYTGMIYIAMPLSLSNLLVFKGGEFSGLLVLSFFIIIWGSDVGAYCFGLLFGKNGKKLFPVISPKKSWAGFWGGLGTAVVTAIILNLTGLLVIPWYHSIILAVLMHVAGVYGDLFESLWKRIYDVKDSGKIIPGHGGFLDRFDSAIFAIPVGAIYLMLTGLI